MIKEMIENADIKRNLSLHSVKDSNLFLRKFYDETSKHLKMGWNIQSYREGQNIFVGFSNFGSMMFDYKIKGRINNIYIKTENEKYHDIIEKTIDIALKEYKNFKQYLIIIEFDTGSFLFETMCRNSIKVEPIKKGSKNAVSISFIVKAFGIFDLRYIVEQKAHYLQHLLCVYTNYNFDIISYKYSEEKQFYLKIMIG